MVIRKLKKLVVDIYRDIDFMNNNSNHADITVIKKIDNEYIAIFGKLCYALSCNDINEVLYFLNHINNTLDIIPLIDVECVKLGVFYKKDNKFIFVRQLNTSKKVGE